MDDDSFVIFTNFDADQKSSHLVRVHANPEVVRDNTDEAGSFNVQTISMTNTNETMTGQFLTKMISYIIFARIYLYNSRT